MKTSIFRIACLCLAGGAFNGGAALAAAPAAAADGPVSAVEIWARGNGAPEGDRAPRGRVQWLNLDLLPLVTVERVDVQYGTLGAFRGIPLKAVIDAFAPDAALDLAILHFANGMAVPVPFRDAAVMKRLDPFIARGMETYRKGPVRAAFFPDIPKKGATADVRPIVFVGNKVVVAEKWHPAVAAAAQPAFSPWSHTDTLTGIELVASGPYYRQFDVSSDSGVQRGLALYRQSCQFCHGTRRVGAKFGWDFVEPLPIFSYQKPTKTLFMHVAYKPLDAAERGLMMPAMKFMTEEDAANLWQWLRAIATKPMPPYTR
jgi:mono/diheme cytochrome c family protein